MKYGLEDSVIQSIVGVFKDYPEVEQVILFGSRAKGNHRPESDIDLVLMGDKLTLSFVFNLEMALDDLLLPYKIDVVIYHKIENPAVKDHITRFGVTIYKK